jgi:hypothetical protein
MHVKVQKEKCIMVDAPEPADDIRIDSVTVSQPVVGINQTFTVYVTVFAPEEDFEDQVGFRLFLHVCPCEGEGPAAISPSSLIKGHVNETGQGWENPTSTFTFTVTAGATPSVYDIRVVLLEGTKGVPDKDDRPSVFCSDCAGSVVVIDPA